MPGIDDNADQDSPQEDEDLLDGVEESATALAEALEALAQLGEEDPRAALEMFSSLPAEVQQLTRFQFEKAVLQREVGDLPLARETLAALVEAEPDDSDAHHLLADVLEDLGEEELARTHFLAVLSLDQADWAHDQNWESTAKTELEHVLDRLPDRQRQLVRRCRPRFLSLPTVALVEAGLDPRALYRLAASSQEADAPPVIELYLANLVMSLDADGSKEAFSEALADVLIAGISEQGGPAWR